jgi:hypothetical protein
MTAEAGGLATGAAALADFPDWDVAGRDFPASLAPDVIPLALGPLAVLGEDMP